MLGSFCLIELARHRTPIVVEGKGNTFLTVPERYLRSTSRGDN